MLDVSEVLDDPDFIVQVTVTPSTSVQWIDGLPVEDAPAADRLIFVSAQPEKAKTYRLEGEGSLRSIESVIYTKEELIGDEDGDKGDIIKGYHGNNWKVLRVKDWIDSGFYRVVIKKLGR